MKDKYNVVIKEYGETEPLEIKGPYSRSKADKIDSGININLNHDKYYTVILLAD